MLLSELIRVFLAWCQVNRRPRTHEYYRAELELWLAAVGDKAVGELVAADLVLHGKGRVRVVCVQRLFNWAVLEAGLVTANPFAAVKKPRVRRRKIALGRRQRVTLRRRASLDLRSLLLCVEETAARPQEVRILTFDHIHTEEPSLPFWDQVVLGQAFFCLEDYKAADRRSDDGPSRIMPISARLGRLLKRLALRYRGEGLLFRTAKGAAWSANSLICRMKRLRERLGWIGPKGGEQICAYTMRHSAATQWAMEGLGGQSLSELLGHRHLRTTERYLHIERYQHFAAWRLMQERKRKQRDGRPPTQE